MSTRPLTMAEDQLIRHLLSTMGGRAAKLLPHLEGAVVNDSEDPERYLQLKVRPDVVPVDLPDAPIPGSALVEGPDGEIRGEIFVWTIDGRLNAIHQGWYAEEPPPSMPEIDAVRVVPAPRWA